MQKRIRLDYIDVFRAIGIILMVYDHECQGSITGHWIHAFHMPMFFWISGFFYRYTNKKVDYIIHKVKTLIVPYFIFGCLGYIYYLKSDFSQGYLEPLQHLLFYNNKKLPIVGAIWFLTALFFCEVIYFLIDYLINYIYQNNNEKSIVKKDILLGIILLILSVLGCYWTQIFSYRLPYSIEASLAGGFIYYIGHICSKYKVNIFIKKIFNLQLAVIFILFIVGLILIFINDYINMRKGTYGMYPLFVLNVLISVVVGVNISKTVLKIEFLKKCNCILMSIGKNSLYYVGLNQIAIRAWDGIFNNIFDTTLWWCKILIFVLTIISIYFFVYIYFLIKNKIYKKDKTYSS